MSLDPSIILDPEPSYINRIPYKVIENKQHSTYIKKFIKDNKVIKYYVYKQDNIGHVYIVFTSESENLRFCLLDMFYEEMQNDMLLTANEYLPSNSCCKII